MRKKTPKTRNRSTLAFHREHIPRCLRSTIRCFAQTAVDVTLELPLSATRASGVLSAHRFLQTIFSRKEVRMAV